MMTTRILTPKSFGGQMPYKSYIRKLTYTNIVNYTDKDSQVANSL